MKYLIVLLRLKSSSVLIQTAGCSYPNSLVSWSLSIANDVFAFIIIRSRSWNSVEKYFQLFKTFSNTCEMRLNEWERLNSGKLVKKLHWNAVAVNIFRSLLRTEESP